MRTRVRVAQADFELDLSCPIDLGMPVVFTSQADSPTQPFGAPAPTATTLRVGSFVGDVGHGGSCNCQTLSLTPHTSGTHTECVAHLTLERVDAWRLLPVGLVPSVLMQVSPKGPAILAADLEAVWPCDLAFSPVAAVIGSHQDRSPADPAAAPFLAPEAVHWLVRRGIEHVVVDIPSLDPVADGGTLAAHRVFFGLPARSTRLEEAQRPRSTVTELARIPSDLPPGSYLLSLQAPAIDGDAVPSRPLLYSIGRAAA